LDQKALVRAEWGIRTIEQQLAELKARLGPRSEWFEMRCYVWDFSEFKSLLQQYGLPEIQNNLAVSGIRVHEDKSLSAGAVELRMVPKMGQLFGTMVE
jgi:hypothetical protein